MRIHAVQRAIIQQKLRCRFRADARNAWNIVRTVTHEGFQVDQMDRVKAIFLAEFCRVIIDRDGLRQLGRNKLNRHMLVDQL